MSTAGHPVGASVRSFENDGLTFPVIDRGSTSAPTVMLLHGFPERADSWAVVSADLRSRGFRTLAFDQRGYSSSARPPHIRDYRVDRLVDDVVALAEAARLERFHLVGHDWGGAVAWAVAGRRPDLVERLTVLSTPHPRALAASLLHSDQALRSLYAAWFQVPVVPETVLTARAGNVLAAALRASGLDDALAATCARAMSEPGAMRAALNWYRAAARTPFVSPGRIVAPTTYVWSSGDAALGRDAAERTARWVDGDYRFVALEGVSHWLDHECPSLVASLIAGRA